MTCKLSESGLSELIAEYAETTSLNGKAAFSGDDKTANYYADIAANAYQRLEDGGHDARTTLMSLLEHDDLLVRYTAAAKLLAIDPQTALPILEDLAHESGVLALVAQTRLDEWKGQHLPS